MFDQNDDSDFIILDICYKLITSFCRTYTSCVHTFV